MVLKKCKSLYNQRKRPAKLAWTTLYRKQHRKDQELLVQRKKRRSVNKNVMRGIGNVSVEVLNKKKNEKPEQRKASREAALREIKERAKKSKAEKAAQKTSVKAKAPVAKNVPRGAGKSGAKSTGR
ncbi:hypothetical protein QBZ16_001667 [Prototheca wickerhamii]|uniref:Large ribosomal subunit protein eL24-related N-terminal domain-containing protein n=1 Tax=Prototheca wickerhamii TaxID=3111 RepID=A0AAD9ID14_PROWI|nr:hypothetical protein QBZ16_001667 [Prototheca wickerhamii]